MIHNDKAFKTSQQRIAYVQNLLLQLRVKATPEEFASKFGTRGDRTQTMADKVISLQKQLATK